MGLRLVTDVTMSPASPVSPVRRMVVSSTPGAVLTSKVHFVGIFCHSNILLFLSDRWN